MSTRTRPLPPLTLEEVDGTHYSDTKVPLTFLGEDSEWAFALGHWDPHDMADSVNAAIKVEGIPWREDVPFTHLDVQRAWAVVIYRTPLRLVHAGADQEWSVQWHDVDAGDEKAFAVTLVGLERW